MNQKIDHIESICKHAAGLGISAKQAAEAGITMLAQACVAMAETPEEAIRLVEAAARDAAAEIEVNFDRAKAVLNQKQALYDAPTTGKPS